MKDARSILRHLLCVAALCGLARTDAAWAAPTDRAPADPPRLSAPAIGAPSRVSRVGGGDEAERQKRLEEKTEEVRFRNGFVLEAPISATGPAGLTPSGPCVVQFPGPIDAAGRGALERLGVEVIDYVQRNALVVEVPDKAAGALEALARTGALRRVARLPAEARIAAELATSAPGEERVTVIFFHLPDESEVEAVTRWLRIDAIEAWPLPLARGVVPSADVRDLAGLDVVRFIEPDAPRSLHNIEGTMAGGSDLVAGVGTYTGAGVRVAVDDSGIARPGPGTAADCLLPSGSHHPDLAGSRIADQWDFYSDDANACDNNGHGTHTAGTIAGDGSYTRDWTGAAPDATLLVYKDCCDATGHGFAHFASVLLRAAAHDAHVVANSWGGWNGVYNSDAWFADFAVRGGWGDSSNQPRRMTLSISTGNDGDLSGSPGTAKNVLSVGATKNGNWPADVVDCFGTLTCQNGCDCALVPSCTDDYRPESEPICFSNHGPIDSDGDGHPRIKPDLVAPGTNTMSTLPFYLFGGQLYGLKSGTSMAQPLVAGTAALMMQAYPLLKDWPEALKAKLLATAIDLGNVNLTGHGMLDAVHAIYDADGLTTALWTGAAAPSTGIEQSFDFNVPAGFKEVRVYLTWSDPPSLSAEVVDDLDLRVYDAAGTLAGISATFDDTVEALRLGSGGVPGTWRAAVRGYNVPDASARYGLVAVVVSEFPGVLADATSLQACIRPGDPFVIDSTLLGRGAPTAAGELTLDLPNNSTFTLEDAWLQTGEAGRGHLFQAADLPHDVAANRYTMTVGLVSPAVPRDVAWGLKASASLLEGTYTLPVEGRGYATFPDTALPTVTLDTAPPGAVSDLASTDRLSGSCSNDATVDMAWSPAPDGAGCGVSGYSVLWSTVAPVMPDATRDIGAVAAHTATLGASSFRYYFNVRAVDGIGNWSSQWQSWGPIKIDQTAPGVVSDLVSPTHPLNACTGDGNVSMQWTAAPDDNCGVAGYSVGWSDGSPLLPDTVRDLDGLVFSTLLPPSNAPRYFSVRAADNAGNWSGTMSTYGPITVDAIPGEVGSLMLLPSGGNLVFGWDAVPDADHYRLERDTSPQFSAPVMIGGLLDGAGYTQAGGMTGTEPIVYFRVSGTNVCGAPGP